MITKVEGFVLSATNYGESSLVINLLTKEYGIIGLMAKGVRSIKSSLRNSTAKFTYGFFYVYYKENKLSILKEVDVINNLDNIKNDLYLISYLSYLTDLTYQVFRESNDHNIYDLFINTVIKLNEGYNPRVLTNILETKYLSYLGVEPYLDGCIKCGNVSNIVTLSDEGLICSNCYINEVLIDIKCIKLLKIYKEINIEKINKLDIKDEYIKPINKFLYDYYERYTGIYLKSRDFLDKLIDK